MNSWRKSYIEALKNGPPNCEMGIAKELIDRDYAKGCIHRMADKSYRMQSWQGLTMEGKALLEKLESEHYRSSDYATPIGATRAVWDYPASADCGAGMNGKVK